MSIRYLYTDNSFLQAVTYVKNFTENKVLQIDKNKTSPNTNYVDT